MATQKFHKDRTSLIPFVLFGILMSLVVYCIIKGNHKGSYENYVNSQKEQDV